MKEYKVKYTGQLGEIATATIYADDMADAGIYALEHIEECLEVVSITEIEE